MRGELRKNETEDTAEHGAVGSNRGVGERQRATEKKEEISHLRHSRVRNGVAVLMTPGPVTTHLAW